MPDSIMKRDSFMVFAHGEELPLQLLFHAQYITFINLKIINNFLNIKESIVLKI